MINFNVDREKCNQCKICVSECPILIINNKTAFPEIIEGKEENCLQCQHCFDCVHGIDFPSFEELFKGITLRVELVFGCIHSIQCLNNLKITNQTTDDTMNMMMYCSPPSLNHCGKLYHTSLSTT